MVIDKLSHELEMLYERIHSCHLCTKIDHDDKALRLARAVNLNTDVFIISQALAEMQLRRSGVNFFSPNGSLGSTGKNLEKFLNKFNRSVYPQREVVLQGGKIPCCHSDMISVYNTEVCQCFPGKNEKGRGGDRVPEIEEVEACLKQGFIEKEIDLINPKLLLLMGKKSRDTFFNYFLNKSNYPNRMKDHILSIVEAEEFPQVRIGNRAISTLPIFHASGANAGNFSILLNDDKLLSLIRRLLND
jgi:uracil-DNA glycosylase